MTKINAPLIESLVPPNNDLVPYLEALQEAITEKGVAVADATAATAIDAPAGGTGAAAGGYDTAANRDLMITSQNAIIDDVAELRTKLNALLSSLRDREIIDT